MSGQRRLPHVGLNSEFSLRDGESAYGTHSTRAEAGSFRATVMRQFEEILSQADVQAHVVVEDAGWPELDRSPVRVVAEVGEAIPEIES